MEALTVRTLIAVARANAQLISVLTAPVPPCRLEVLTVRTQTAAVKASVLPISVTTARVRRCRWGHPLDRTPIAAVRANALPISVLMALVAPCLLGLHQVNMQTAHVRESAPAATRPHMTVMQPENVFKPLAAASIAVTHATTLAKLSKRTSLLSTGTTKSVTTTQI